MYIIQVRKKTLNTPNAKPKNLSKYPIDVDLKILRIGIDNNLQTISVNINTKDIMITSLIKSFSIIVLSKLEILLKKILILTKAITHPNNAKSSLKKPWYKAKDPDKTTVKIKIKSIKLVSTIFPTT